MPKKLKVIVTYWEADCDFPKNDNGESYVEITLSDAQIQVIKTCAETIKNLNRVIYTGDTLECGIVSQFGGVIDWHDYNVKSDYTEFQIFDGHFNFKSCAEDTQDLIESEDVDLSELEELVRYRYLLEGDKLIKTDEMLVGAPDRWEELGDHHFAVGKNVPSTGMFRRKIPENLPEK